MTLGSLREEGLAAPQPPSAADAARSPWWLPVLALTALAAWVVLRTPPGRVPGVESHEVIAGSWPLSPVIDQTAYLLRAPLGPLVYQALPVSGLEVFLLLHAATLGLSGLLLGVWLLRRYGYGPGAVAVAVLLLSPLTAILLLWMGIYDAFSVLAWVLLVLSLGSHRTLQVAAAALAGVQNFEQVLVGVLLLALLPALPRAAGWRPWVPGLLGGALVGRVVLELYLRSVGAHDGSRLSFLLEDPVRLYVMVMGFVVNVPLIAASVLGGLWAFAAPALGAAWAGWSTAQRVRLLVAVALWAAAGAAGADHTRVMVLCSVPLLVAGAVVLGRTAPSFGGFWRQPAAWVLLLFPPVIVFGDIILPLGSRLVEWGLAPQ